MRLFAALALLSLLFAATPSLAAAQSLDGANQAPAPYGSEVRRHYYEHLYRSPFKALAWDLALPGAGNIYNGIYIPAIITVVVSLAGAGLWIAGATSDRDGLWWAGAGTFAAGRLFGVVSAPVGSAMLNGAFRRQLGLTTRF